MLDFDPPIFINVRDRVTHLRDLVGWLERAGHEKLVLLDNQSTYGPLLDYLAGVSHKVVRLDRNYGSRALWRADLVPAEWFVYTDPDIIPTDDCPLALVARCRWALDRYPQFQKCGVGLYLEDVPASLPSLSWERSLVAPNRLLERGVYSSLADTTFALHRPGTVFGYGAIRLGAPYQARHASWYVTDEVGDEDAYYLERAIAGPDGSSWADHVRNGGPRG